MKIKLAMYKDMDYLNHDQLSFLEYKDEKTWPETSDTYMRVTEVVEIDFIKLENIQAEITAKQVAVIDNKVALLFEKIQELNDEKQSLLCLTQEKIDETIN